MNFYSPKEKDFHNRLCLYITETFPQVVLDDTNDNVTSVKYRGEPARILMYHGEAYEKPCLIVKLTQDFSKAMSETNGKEYPIISIDSMNKMRFAIKAILDVNMPNITKGNLPLKKEAGVGEGYLINRHKEVLGVVDLSKIPQTMLKKDKENVEESKKSIPEKRGFYEKFFK